MGNLIRYIAQGDPEKELQNEKYSHRNFIESYVPQTRTPRGRLGGDWDSGVPALPRRRVRPGKAPRRGTDTRRKHCPVPPQADRREVRFFTSFPGTGRRTDLPQALPRAFFFGSPKPFLFGPFQKEMGSETSRPGTAFLADHFFFAKKKRSAPQRKIGPGSGRVLLFPAPRNTVIAGMPSSRA